MAWVYKGEHMRLQSHVAIKVLSSLVAYEADSRQRFLREARLQHELQHTNIVRVHDVFEEDDLCAIVMEWCGEGDLLEWFKKRRRPIEPEHVRMFFLPLLDALAHAHEHGVIHRDLKPQNILLTKHAGEYAPKLTDFGIAKELGGDTFTQTGATVGTIRYISPEQLYDSKRVDHRADIYSFGAMLYLMTTGRHAFTSTGPVVLQQILYEEPPPPSEAPAALQGLILRCMAKDPNKRFPDCKELKSALKLALKLLDSGVSASPTGSHVGSASTPSYSQMRAAASSHSRELSFEDSKTEVSSDSKELSFENSRTEVSKEGMTFAMTGRKAAAARMQQLAGGLVPMEPHPVHTEPMAVPDFASLTGEREPAQAPKNKNILLFLVLGLVLLVAGMGLFVLFRSAQPKKTIPSRLPKLQKQTNGSTSGSVVTKSSLPDSKPSTPGVAPRSASKPERRKASPNKREVRRAVRKLPKRRARRHRRARHTKPYRVVNGIRRYTIARKKLPLIPRSQQQRKWPPIPKQFPTKRFYLTMKVALKLARIWARSRGTKESLWGMRLLRKLCRMKMGRGCGELGLALVKRGDMTGLRYTKMGCLYGTSASCSWHARVLWGVWRRHGKIDKNEGCEWAFRGCEMRSTWACADYKTWKCPKREMPAFMITQSTNTYYPPREKKTLLPFDLSVTMARAMLRHGNARYLREIGKLRDVVDRTCKHGVGYGCFYQAYLLEKKSLKRALSFYIRACELGLARSCHYVFSLTRGATTSLDAVRNRRRACTYFRRYCVLSRNMRSNKCAIEAREARCEWP